MTGRKSQATPAAKGETKSGLQRQCACGNHSHGTPECEQCRNNHAALLQRYPSSRQTGGSLNAGVPSIVRDVLNSSGQPLDAQTRGFMESRFGNGLVIAPMQKNVFTPQTSLKIGEPGDRLEREADRIADQVTRTRAVQHTSGQQGVDFSFVRVHTDARAAESARTIDARAYTVGRHVVFDSGEYAPGTGEGRRLLAHELTHVVQQGSQEHSGPDRFIRRTPRGRTAPAPARRLEVRPSVNGAPCACLVFIHNNERNARAAAEELHQTCSYNLAIIQPGGGREIRVPGRAGTVDPNELFPQDVQQDCTRDGPACAAYAQSHSDLRATQIQFFLAIRDCSNSFALPIVALHNNVISDTQEFLSGTSASQRQALRGDVNRGAASGPGSRASLRTSLGGRGRMMDQGGMTNIFRWCNLPEVTRCHIGDPHHPDNVVWVTTVGDFDRLSRQDVNVALQDRPGGESETDLSTLMLRQPGTRYVNIETPGSPENRGTRARNMSFIQQALQHAGLRCCDPVTVEPRLPDPLPYREATNLVECVRIMGEENAAFCRRQILRESQEDEQGLFGRPGRRSPAESF